MEPYLFLFIFVVFFISTHHPDNNPYNITLHCTPNTADCSVGVRIFVVITDMASKKPNSKSNDVFPFRRYLTRFT